MHFLMQKLHGMCSPGGILMWDVLSGVAENGMGRLVWGGKSM